LIDLLGGKDKGDNEVFLDRRNIPEGVFQAIALSHKKLKEDASCGQHPSE
jgi:hypothetical protein